jgi:transposase-like protein
LKQNIELYLAGLSLSNTVLFLEVFDVERVQFTIYDWVYKADLQAESDRSPNHIAVDETVIQLNSEQYWLYVAALLTLTACSTFDVSNENERDFLDVSLRTP